MKVLPLSSAYLGVGVSIALKERTMNQSHMRAHQGLWLRHKGSGGDRYFSGSPSPFLTLCTTSLMNNLSHSSDTSLLPDGLPHIFSSNTISLHPQFHSLFAPDTQIRASASGYLPHSHCCPPVMVSL